MDGVTLAILKGRLEQIADEMDATLFRAAFNPTIAEAHDACHGLYHRTTGDTLVQGKSGLPIFVGTMAFATKAVIDKFPDAAQGDIFIFNDPYLGGTHLSDVRLIAPFVRAPFGRAPAASACRRHWGSGVQKFRGEDGSHAILTQRDNVIVIADEAHRTQLDFGQFRLACC